MDQSVIFILDVSVLCVEESDFDGRKWQLLQKLSVINQTENVRSITKKKKNQDLGVRAHVLARYSVM